MKKNLLFSIAAVLILFVGIYIGTTFNNQKNTSDSISEKEVAPEEIEYINNEVVSNETNNPKSAQATESKKEIEYLTSEDKEWVFQETYDNTQQMIKDQGGSDSQCFEAELDDLPIYLDYYKETFNGRVSPGIDTLREEYKTWRIEKYGDGTSSKSEVSKPSETTQQQKPSSTQTQQKPSSNQTNGQSNGNNSGSSSLGYLGSSGALDESINIIGENRTQEQIEKDIQAMKEASEKAYEAGIKFN